MQSRGRGLSLNGVPSRFYIIMVKFEFPFLPLLEERLAERSMEEGEIKRV